ARSRDHSTELAAAPLDATGAHTGGNAGARPVAASTTGGSDVPPPIHSGPLACRSFSSISHDHHNHAAVALPCAPRERRHRSTPSATTAADGPRSAPYTCASSSNNGS